MTKIPTTGEDASYTAAAEAQLLAGLRALDPRAFEVLLQRFEAPVFRYFYYSHGDHDRAQDECGETFAQLVISINRMRGGPEALRAYVFGIARNVQRRGWRVNHPVMGTEDEIDNIADGSESAFTSISRRQEFQRALQYIREFEDPARQVLLLRYVEELKISEVADGLALPVNTVKSLLRRSCQQLRQKMESDMLKAGDKA